MQIPCYLQRTHKHTLTMQAALVDGQVTDAEDIVCSMLNGHNLQVGRF